MNSLPVPAITISVSGNRAHIGKTAIVAAIAKSLSIAGMKNISIKSQDGDLMLNERNDDISALGDVAINIEDLNGNRTQHTVYTGITKTTDGKWINYKTNHAFESNKV